MTNQKKKNKNRKNFKIDYTKPQAITRGFFVLKGAKKGQKCRKSL
nr:MAG TPA: hypothetical protein [Caudoviricetes sp.]